MRFPQLSEDFRQSRLTLPAGRLDMVLDTDTFNEVDDQFALAYALLSPERLRVQAVYAAPFLNPTVKSPGEGMEKSYAEILRLLKTMGRPAEGLVYKGAQGYLPGAGSPAESPAAINLVTRAMERGDKPLYVAAIGAPTNIASALLLEPEIIKKIVVVWLGGQPYHWHTAAEFNLSQDLFATQLLFNSGVPLVHIPAVGVSSHLLTTVHELKAYLGGKSPLCNALIELFASYAPDPFAYAKEIWDIAAIAYLLNPDWVPSALQHSPLLTNQHTWSTDPHRHFVRCAYYAYRNLIFKDLFFKLGGES